VQGQIASSLSGNVYRNVLLGLPHDKEIYTNEEIIEILNQVGIWDIFAKKQGLETPIGEAGLTLSGGQRQRLNFASLYMRAKYYKPALILIDEPTSSLDAVSEIAITTMISELAQTALTIVIAHRLKTIEEAVGILDFSLIDTEKEIIFYPRTELEKKSQYYQKLMHGAISLEDH
jgi:ATP-binding cassette subfamily B protein